MEQIINILKSFIKDIFPEYTAQYESRDCTLPDFTEKNIVVGSVDLSRYELPVVCAILPENQIPEENSVSEWNDTTKLTVAFVCQKAVYDLLIKRMCRYASAFKRAVINDYTLGNMVENTSIDKVSFFYDAGAVEEQVTVCEIELTIITAEEYSM